MTTTSTLLRASCDRCRAQKLRCLPSSETDATAPCQRCLHSKGIKSCVFGRRSRSGRNKRSSMGEIDSKWPVTGTNKRFREKEGMELPGMATFSLSAFSNGNVRREEVDGDRDGEGRKGLEHEDEKCLPNATNSNPDLSLWPVGQENLDLNLDTMLPSPASTTQSACFLISNTATDDLVTSVPKNSTETDFNACFDITTSLSSNQDFLLGPTDSFLHSTPFDTSLDLDLDIDFWTRSTTRNTTTDEKPPTQEPNTLLSLTTLLTSLSNYESKLNSHHSIDPDNYPIGDALFLSQRFCVILSSSSSHNSTSSSSICQNFTPDMPAMLLTLSCYIILTRISSSVFSYLHEHLSHLPNSYSDGKNRPEDMKVYQGLRLGELQPIDMSAGRELATRAKKAVFMLLSSLGDAEGMLSLPGDVRVIASSRVETHGQDGLENLKGRHGSKEKVLFDVGIIVGLTNGRLYKAMREQARTLRSKVEDIEDLLKRLLDF